MQGRFFFYFVLFYFCFLFTPQGKIPSIKHEMCSFGMKSHGKPVALTNKYFHVHDKLQLHVKSVLLC